MKWYKVVNSAGTTWEIRANSEQEAIDQAEAMIPYEKALPIMLDSVPEFDPDYYQDEDDLTLYFI